MARLLLLICAALCVAVPARASELDLSWAAPAPCPNAASVRARVTELVGDAPVPDGLRVRASVLQRSAAAWNLTIEIRTPSHTGQRELEAASCEQAADAAALIVAYAIDPERATAGSSEPAVAAFPPAAPARQPLLAAPLQPAPEQPAPLRLPPPERDEAPREQPPPHDDDGSALRGRALVLGGVDAGTLPAPAPGLSAGLGIAIGSWRVSAEARLLGEQRGRVDGDGTRGADVGFVGGAAVGCWLPLSSGRFAAGPCAGAEAGVLSARGFGVSDPSSGSVVRIAGLAGGALSVGLDPTFALSLRAELAVPVARPRFYLERIGTVHEPAVVSGKAHLGGEVRFP